jgi:hypothetical protein
VAVWNSGALASLPINILGKCSRLLYSEFGGHDGFRHLLELGLAGTQARTYAWATRVRMVPKPANRTKKKNGRPAASLTVPLTDVLGIATRLEQQPGKD